jgi:phage gp45-like
MRTTLGDTARRAQTNASRATLRKLNSGPLWSEAKQVDVMKSETHSDVEYIENYGATSYPADQDDDEQQQKPQQQQQQSQDVGAGNTEPEFGEQPQGDSAEAIVLYLNGSRSHPVIIGIGDRRHRLVELEQGDVAQHRLKDDRQQVLLHSKGTYISTRDDKQLRLALVPKEQEQKQQQGGGKQAGPVGQQNQQNQEKKYGQKSARDDNLKSQVAIEQNGQQTYSQHGETYGTQKGGSDSTIHYEKDKKKSAQSTEKHTHIRFKDHRIFNDEDGNFWTSPCLVKKDQHCKEG